MHIHSSMHIMQAQHQTRQELQRLLGSPAVLHQAVEHPVGSPCSTCDGQGVARVARAAQHLWARRWMWAGACVRKRPQWSICEPKLLGMCCTITQHQSASRHLHMGRQGGTCPSDSSLPATQTPTLTAVSASNLRGGPVPWTCPSQAPRLPEPPDPASLLLLGRLGREEEGRAVEVGVVAEGPKWSSDTPTAPLRGAGERVLHGILLVLVHGHANAPGIRHGA